MSAMTRASKPSGAPVSSSRPSAFATYFRSATGRTSGRVERLQQGENLGIDMVGDRSLAEVPVVDVLVGLIHQRLEGVELGGGHARDVLVRKRPQNEVRFPEATAPGPQPDLLEAVLVHVEAADIERVAVRRHPTMTAMGTHGVRWPGARAPRPRYTTLNAPRDSVEPLVERVAGSLVRDVLFLGPQSLIHRTPTTVDSVVDGQVHTLTVDVELHTKPARMDIPWKIRCFDGTAFLTLIWFKGHGEHLLRQHPVGSKRVVSGKIERWGNEIQMAHPDYIVPVERAAEIPETEAVYPATAGLPARNVRKMAHEALSRTPFKSIAEAQALIPSTLALDASRVDVKSNFFEVRGRIRL
eukprot:gene2228-3007_t